jgi:mannosyltransferase
LTTDTRVHQRVPHAFYLTAIGIAAIVCWILPTRHPLSRDEIGTFWIVKDSLADAVSRSYYWTNWSPYYLIEWPAVHIGGTSEFVMRLPSVAAMALAAFLVFCIGRRLWDEEAGVLAALVFSVMPDIGFAAGDARPYAFTLVALAACTLAILRWIESGSLGDAVAASVLAALTAYGHVVLSLGLVVPALYAVWSRPKSWHLPLAAALTAVLVLPLVAQLRAYMGMGTSHFAGYFPVLDDLWAAIASAQFLATIGVGMLIAFVMRPGLSLRWGLSRSSTVFLASWMIFAPALLFALARTQVASLFLGRYLISTAIPQALLYGALIRAIGPMKARNLIAATVVVVSAVAFVVSAKSFHGEGWKDAMAAVRAEVAGSDMPLVMTSPFVEAESEASMNDPRLKEVLFSPVLAYPAAPRLIRLPYRFDEAYATRIVQTDLVREHDFVLLTNSDALAEWFTRQLANRHPRSNLVGVFRGLRVYRFRIDPGI